MNTDKPHFYVIHLESVIDDGWMEWFPGMALTYSDHTPAETILSGYVADQAALYGMLERIRDLNVTLLSVRQTKPAEANQSNR